VHSPKILSNVERPIVILRVGAYAEEIKRGILEVNARTVFWE
jgi:cathepsin L